MKSFRIISLLFILLLVISCQPKEQVKEMKEETSIAKRLAAFAPVNITTDLSALTENQKKMVELLIEAGKLADEIFWKQNSVDGISMRDSLKKLNTPESQELLKYLHLWYGPYDAMYDEQRFGGKGAKVRPKVGNFYPQDMTQQEFENYIKANPNETQPLENQYTVVVRDGAKLKAIPYHEAYPEMLQMADLLDKAATYCDNQSFKNYLVLRAKALRTDDYYESDMAWMDIKGSDIDIVIGPIENYADALFNYKTAFECVVMVKDKEATKELEMFESNIDLFEHNLPYSQKYIRQTAGKGNILQIANVAYFGGDCNSGTKTIAASLPNDPKVTQKKGGKKSMYKNIMEAKFDKIVVPIANKIMADELIPFCDKKSFTSFVTLHEVSHTLGRGYVYGDEKLEVRKALKERYSAIEELKADLLGMYNHKHLLAKGLITEDILKRTIATYIPGLYRSIRFGAEEAHGKANVMQLNYLVEKGAIIFDKNGKLNYNPATFMDKVGEFAGIVLTLQAEGNYQSAGELIDKYGKINDKTRKIIESLSDVSRDIDNR